MLLDVLRERVQCTTMPLVYNHLLNATFIFSTLLFIMATNNATEDNSNAVIVNTGDRIYDRTFIAVKPDGVQRGLVLILFIDIFP